MVVVGLLLTLSGCETQQVKPQQAPVVVKTPPPVQKVQEPVKKKPAIKKPVRPKPLNSLALATTALFGDVYKDHPVSFYCRCSFDESLITAPERCGIYNKELANAHRSKRIELEHIIPVNWLKSKRPRALNDLQNLMPVNGQLNGNRHQLPFVEQVPDGQTYGLCKVVDNVSGREVPARIQGDIARIYFYMKFFYGIKAGVQDEALLKRWAKEDPVDQWEKQRNNRIRKIQGMGNPYVEWKKIK